MQKTKYEGLYKVQEGILLNTDNEALKQYKARKQKERKLQEMQKDLDMLKEGFQELKEVKELLMILVKDKERSKES